MEYQVIKSVFTAQVAQWKIQTVYVKLADVFKLAVFIVSEYVKL